MSMYLQCLIINDLMKKYSILKKILRCLYVFLMLEIGFGSIFVPLVSELSECCFSGPHMESVC